MRGANLALATWVSAINFWAWNMIGPLSTTYATDMSLSSTEASMLVATPILVGSLGRIAVGAMTDRYGGRAMFIAVSLLSIVPVVAVGFAAEAGSYPLLLVCGFFLGIAGTIFAVGIPFANNWYEPARRGFATGVFGAGMVGTALSAFFTPRFVNWFGLVPTHIVVAAALAVTAVVCILVMRNAPEFRPNTDPVLPKLTAAAKLGVTWEMSFLYAVVFGGFVAFSNYLPTYIKTIYGFSAVDAGTRTAGFALAAVLARPVGGALSDRGAAEVRGPGLLRRYRGDGGDRDLPAPARPVVGADVHHDGDLPGHRHRWCLRVGGASRPGTRGGQCHRHRRRSRWARRLLPAPGDGRDLRREGNDYTVGLLLLAATALVCLLYTAFRLHTHEPPPTAAGSGARDVREEKS